MCKIYCHRTRAVAKGENRVKISRKKTEHNKNFNITLMLRITICRLVSIELMRVRSVRSECDSRGRETGRKYHHVLSFPGVSACGPRECGNRTARRFLVRARSRTKYNYCQGFFFFGTDCRQRRRRRCAL